MTRKQRLRRRSERGAELIELAIVLPILLFIVAGIMDFGFLFQRYEALTNAAREGARMASMPEYTDNDVIARVQEYLNASGLTDPPTTFAVITPSTLTLSTGTTIEVKQVTVFHPAEFSYLGPIASMVGGGNWTSIMLRADSIMRVEPGAGGS